MLLRERKGQGSAAKTVCGGASVWHRYEIIVALDASGHLQAGVWRQ